MTKWYINKLRSDNKELFSECFYPFILHISKYAIPTYIHCCKEYTYNNCNIDSGAAQVFHCLSLKKQNTYNNHTLKYVVAKTLSQELPFLYVNKEVYHSIFKLLVYTDRRFYSYWV